MKAMSRGTPHASRQAVLLSFFIATFPLFSAAEEVPREAQQLINEMSRAVRELNYDGTFIYRHGDQVDTMRLIHKADGAGGEMERMYSLTGIAREVIRNNESVTCIFPDDQSVVVEKSRPQKFVAQLPEPIESVAEYYNFTVAGTDRVAGRDAWVVDIQPRDMYRYGYHLWIDKDSKLLLKTELRNKSGHSLEEMMFTQIALLDSVPDELLKPAISGKDYTWFDNAGAADRAERKDGKWNVTWMPGGFSLKDHEQQSMATSRQPVEHMVFTDGLAVVSVFVEQILDEPPGKNGPSRMGGVNAFARFANGYQVTAVGEVPQATVQRMANSVVADR